MLICFLKKIRIFFLCSVIFIIFVVVVVVVVVVFVIETGNPPGKELTTWPIVVFLISALFTLGMSAFFHLCFVHDEITCIFLCKLDYLGIGFLIVGSAYVYFAIFIILCYTVFNFFGNFNFSFFHHVQSSLCLLWIILQSTMGIVLPCGQWRLNHANFYCLLFASHDVG